MRRPKKRTVLILAALLLLGGVTYVVWEVADWPPVRLILKYGFPPTGGPTGNVKTIEGIEFIELKPGYFRMGSHYLCAKGDLLGRICMVFGMPWGASPVHDGIECPTRWTEIQHRLWIAETEITNEQYERYDDEHKRSPSSRQDTGPVVDVSRHDAQSFCGWLAETARLAVRLPGEAEWEFACRGGSETEYCFGDTVSDLGNYAWLEENSETHARKVATKKPNQWGLYDFHGNVWEWCADTYRRADCAALPDGSAKPNSSAALGADGQPAVVRGGCWFYGAELSRSSCRWGVKAAFRTMNFGFRPVFTLPEDE